MLPEKLVPHIPTLGFAGFVAAAVIMLLVTQYKERVPGPTWLIPAVGFVLVAALSAMAIVMEGPEGLWFVHAESVWGIQGWYDRLAAVTVAFYLIQNRARAAGMKSEIWVILVIFTGSLGLLPMLARMLHLERQGGPRPLTPDPLDPPG